MLSKQAKRSVMNKEIPPNKYSLKSNKINLMEIFSHCLRISIVFRLRRSSPLKYFDIYVRRCYSQFISYLLSFHSRGGGGKSIAHPKLILHNSYFSLKLISASRSPSYRRVEITKSVFPSIPLTRRDCSSISVINQNYTDLTRKFISTPEWRRNRIYCFFNSQSRR